MLLVMVALIGTPKEHSTIYSLTNELNYLLAFQGLVSTSNPIQLEVLVEGVKRWLVIL